jgi:hypothetical protein
MVYVASYRQLNVFGLKRPQPAAALTSLQIKRAEAAAVE